MKTNTIITFLVLTICVSFLAVTGCSSTDDPADTATVSMVAETEGSIANAAFRKGRNSPAAGAIADSVEITRVRFLLSRVKLHVEGNDTLKDGDIKTGPFIIEFTPGLSKVFTTATIPAGSYEKIKFEIHKFPSSIDQTYLNDPVFTDFVTNERSTVIIEGKVWSAQNTTPTNFVFKSDITANLEAKFPGNITLDAGSTTTLAMIFSPILAFKASSVLDPRDAANANDIDNYLKAAIKSLKK